ncbi:MAG: IS110 family transposase [Anaeromyxobacteraceae bacterium]
MEGIVVDRVCGLDVHKEQVTACVLLGEGSRLRKCVREFSTFTRDLLALVEWLREEHVTHVAMESTGVYWKPVYAVLESAGELELVVGNAQHMKNVPGRKTDVKDSEWIARLVRMGLIRKSYVPPLYLRDLRDLVRYRRSVVQARTSERNRLQKVLETANVKLASVASDVFGKSGMAMLRAMADGESDPRNLAKLAEGLLRKKIPELEAALDGRLRDHHRYMLRLQLDRLDAADRDVDTLEREIERRLEPYREQVKLLSTIPGVKVQTSASLLAEIGPDMSVFGGPRHLASWAGVCPGNDESAGKRRSGRSRKGNVHLRSTLVEAAGAAIRTKKTYLRDKYFRLKARRGHKRATFAIAHKILNAAYEIPHETRTVRGPRGHLPRPGRRKARRQEPRSPP